MRVFLQMVGFSRAGVRTIITNQEQTQGVGTGVRVRTKSVQVKEEIHVDPQQVLETPHVLLGVRSKQLHL